MGGVARHDAARRGAARDGEAARWMMYHGAPHAGRAAHVARNYHGIFMDEFLVHKSNQLDRNLKDE